MKSVPPSGRRSICILRLALLCAASLPLLVCLSGQAADSVHPPKRVLILYSFDDSEAIYAGFDRALRSELRADLPDRVEFYTEYLDLVRFPSAAHAANLVKSLQLEFSEQKPDLIVPVSYAAVQFLLGEGKELFPGTSVVALFNARRLDELKQRITAGTVGRDITGVASTDDLTQTLDLALQLQPDTLKVAVPVGTSAVDQYWAEQIRHDLEPYRQKVEVTYLAGLTMDQLLKRVAELPPHTIILSAYFFEDSSGQFFLQEEALDLITHSADVPVYAIYSSYLGHGVVGGRMTDPETAGRQIAKISARVLNSDRAAAIPFAFDDSARDRVDWRQLQRWRLSEQRLPAGTSELFREPSLWERYRYLMIAVVSLCILEAVLIMALLLNMRRRRTAEHALRQEKALAEAVIESLPGIFVLQDRTGKNVRWNRNAENVSRIKPGKVGNLDNIADEFKEAAQRAREEVFERGSGHLRADLLLREGGAAPYYFTGVRVELEDKPYLAAVGIDLSENRQAEEAVRRSEAELRSFVENAPYGIGTISIRQDRFLRANPALVKLLGYHSEAEVLALTISRDLYPDGENSGFRAQPTRADFFSAVEFTWKRKDHKPVVVRASGRRLSSPAGGGDILEVIAEDVSATRRLEEQLQHSQKMEALGQLAGSIAHDFNNLLGVIIGYSELLSAETGTKDPISKRLDTIKSAGVRAASLTSQLLAFSRRQVLQPRVLDLNSLVSETQRMLQRLVGEDIEQKILLDPALGKTKADPGQMVQVIMNLAVNARDAMPSGGKLTIATANLVFAEGTTFQGVPVPPGRYVTLSVTDTGTGMDADTLKHIFEPFFTTKQPGKGTGLGLATVYGIVKQSGGYVFADSEPERGSTFRVYLPQVNLPLEPPPSRPEERKMVPSVSTTVLVVEDERSFRDLLCDGLESRGYRVLAASNGVEALQVAEQQNAPIRVLITDLIMPQMSGPELARCLTEVRSDLKVLYMSGYADDRVEKIVGQNGDLTWIQKPFYIDDLVRKIQEIVEQNPKP